MASDATDIRLRSLERRVGKLEDLEPAVMRREIVDLREDVQSIVKDISTVKKMLMSFIITFSVTAVTLVVLIFTALNKP